MRNKRILIVAVGILVVLVIAGVIYLSTRRGNEAGSTTPNFDANNSAQEPEHGGPKTVVLINTDFLAQALLSNQFEVVKTQLITYIQGLNSNISSAQIVGKPTINGDGSIDFTVRTTAPVHQFPVHIVRVGFDQLIFSVPGTNYSQTIQVYGTSGAADYAN